MWNWFNCYLSGRHEYGIGCEPGAIFLRCVHCGRRSTGWAVGGKEPATTVTQAPVRATERKAATAAATAAPRVIPFNRSAAS